MARVQRAPRAIYELALIPVVIALGVGQIIMWGTLFYSIAVLAIPISAGLAVSETLVFGAYTVALVCSGLVAPTAGRAIDRYGGAYVLAGATVLGAVALTVLGAAAGPNTLLLGWMLIGIAMGGGLYDAAFGTLHQFAPGPRYPRAVTALTLLGGFASTVFWPVAHSLEDAFDWRTTCFAFAAVLLSIALPLHVWVARHERIADVSDERTPPTMASEGCARRTARLIFWLSAAFALASFLAAVVSAHFITILSVLGFTTEQAIRVGTLFGPMQVAARIIEYALAKRVRAVTVGTTAFMLMLAGMLLLFEVGALFWLAYAFALCYGAANGIMSIVRGTVPAELFNTQQYATLLGRIALPSFVAKALAPLGFSVALASGARIEVTLGVLVFIAALGLLCFQIARSGKISAI